MSRRASSVTFTRHVVPLLWGFIALESLPNCSGSTASGGGKGGTTAAGGTNQGTSGIGGTASGTSGSAGDGGISGYFGFGGHTAGCIGQCGGACPPCATGGAGTGGMGAAGVDAGGQADGGAPPAARSAARRGNQACYALAGYEADACLPADDSLLQWLAPLPTTCTPSVIDGPELLNRLDGRACCYSVACRDSTN